MYLLATCHLCAAGVRKSCPAPGKPMSGVCCRGLPFLECGLLLTAGQPFQFAGLFQSKKSYSSVMGTAWDAAALSRQTSAKQVDAEVKQKGICTICICFTSFRFFWNYAWPKFTSPYQLAYFFSFPFLFCLLINFKESIIVDSIDSGP